MRGLLTCVVARWRIFRHNPRKTTTREIRRLAD
jgi:hypothetical protein